MQTTAYAHRVELAVYSRPPFAKWFVGGETNLCYNALDRHLAERGDQKAGDSLSPPRSCSLLGDAWC